MVPKRKDWFFSNEENPVTLDGMTLLVFFISSMCTMLTVDVLIIHIPHR